MTGRPTKYAPEYDQQVYKLALLSATDREMADFLNVCEDTFHEWKKVHPSFSESINRGKNMADANVASRLYERAMGYSHPEEKVFCSEGEVVTYATTKHYPPDTMAASLWLRNRQPAKWRDKTEQVQSGTGANGEIITQQVAMTADEYAKMNQAIEGKF